MIIELEVLLEDEPGMLIGLLTPISENNCNLQGIYHGQKREDDNTIPVYLKFEVADSKYRKIIEVLEQRFVDLNIQVLKFAPTDLKIKDVKSKKRAVLVILDGATDFPSPTLGNRTPLEAANIPTLDRLAMEGVCGLFSALGPAVLVGSDTAILSIIGYDPRKVYTGRGPLEVAGVGLELEPGDVSIRCNYVTISDDFKLLNRTAGYPRDGIEVLEEAINQIELSDSKVEFIFRNSQDYRCVVKFRGYNISAEISDMDPTYNAIPDALDNLDLLGEGESKIITSKPLSQTIEAKNMATLLNEFVTKAHLVLKDLPYNQKRSTKGLPAVNGIMPRGAGETPSLASFRTQWGLKGGCVAGTGLIKGIARLTGMIVPDIPGATGYIDTDYLAKAKATCQLLDEGADFVLVHVEGIDEVSHDKDVNSKINAIEDSSEILLRHLLENLPEDVILCVLSDHTTSSLIGDHTIDPAGIVYWSRKPLYRADRVEQFSETEFAKGSLSHVEGKDVMPLMMGFAQRIKKFGA